MTLEAAPAVPAAPVAKRGPGRPRDADIEDRLIDAVIELIDADEAVTVTAVVERSGVSRAALYRRWSTMAQLIAAALDRGREVIEIPEEFTLREALAHGYPVTPASLLAGYQVERIRQRLRLALADRDLQHEYWESHMVRRRVPMQGAFRRAVERGEMRADVDVDAVQDLLSGMFYYQIVARGADFDDPATLERCAAAVEILLRGLTTGASSSQSAQESKS